MVWTEQHSERVGEIYRLDAEIRDRAALIQEHLRELVRTNPLGFSSVAYSFEQDAERQARDMAERADVIDRDTERFAELSGMPGVLAWVRNWLSERRAA